MWVLGFDAFFPNGYTLSWPLCFLLLNCFYEFLLLFLWCYFEKNFTTCIIIHFFRLMLVSLYQWANQKNKKNSFFLVTSPINHIIKLTGHGLCLCFFFCSNLMLYWITKSYSISKMHNNIKPHDDGDWSSGDDVVLLYDVLIWALSLVPLIVLI